MHKLNTGRPSRDTRSEEDLQRGPPAQDSVGRAFFAPPPPSHLSSSTRMQHGHTNRTVSRTAAATLANSRRRVAGTRLHLVRRHIGMDEPPPTFCPSGGGLMALLTAMDARRAGGPSAVPPVEAPPDDQATHDDEVPPAAQVCVQCLENWKFRIG
jgi:hypothetical protein